MIQVKLMGELGELFGTDWQCAGKSMRDVVKLIECQTEGFGKKINEYVENDIGLDIVHGKDLLVEKEEDLVKLNLPVLKDTVFITPVPVGSSMKKVRGALKLVAAAIIAYYTIAVLGPAVVTAEAGKAAAVAALKYAAAGAAASLLAMSGINDIFGINSPSDSPESYLFGNSVESIKQGAPVPLAYGEVIVPGIAINVGYIPQKLPGKAYHGIGGFGGSSTVLGSEGDLQYQGNEGTTLISGNL